MSQHLGLWEPSGQAFELRQTPTAITRDVLAQETAGARAARYLAWHWETSGDSDIGDIEWFMGHGAELLDWLLAHPDHSWVST